MEKKETIETKCSARLLNLLFFITDNNFKYILKTAFALMSIPTKLSLKQWFAILSYNLAVYIGTSSSDKVLQNCEFLSFLVFMY